MRFLAQSLGLRPVIRCTCPRCVFCLALKHKKISKPRKHITSYPLRPAPSMLLAMLNNLFRHVNDGCNAFTPCDTVVKHYTPNKFQGKTRTLSRPWKPRLHAESHIRASLRSMTSKDNLHAWIASTTTIIFSKEHHKKRGCFQPQPDANPLRRLPQNFTFLRLHTSTPLLLLAIYCQW